MTDRAKALLTLGVFLTLLLALYISSAVYQEWWAKKYRSNAEGIDTVSSVAQPVITYELQLLTWNWQRTETGSYVEAKGQVKNISGRRLESVAAVVTFYDASGAFITYGHGLIEYSPIMPNQVSPFSVLERYNPAMKRATIEFQNWPFGGTYLTKYP